MCVVHLCSNAPSPPLPVPRPARQKLIGTNEKTQVMSRRGGQAAGSPGASKCFAHLAAGDHMTDYYAIVMQLLKSRRTVGPPFGQLKSLSEA